MNGDLRSDASEIAAEVMERAGEWDVAVSGTVTDLVAGSELEFERMEGLLAKNGRHRLPLYRIASQTVSAPMAANARPSAASKSKPLSQREREVAVLIGRGLSNREIADTLSISIATVERHADNIFNKLGVCSRSSVAVWAAEQGLLSVDAG